MSASDPGQTWMQWALGGLAAVCAGAFWIAWYNIEKLWDALGKAKDAASSGRIDDARVYATKQDVHELKADLMARFDQHETRMTQLVLGRDRP